MAKATPVTKAPEGPQEPAKAEDRSMAPAAPLVSKKVRPEPVQADPADLEALVAAAKAEGKTVTVFGNAVRVDN